MNKKLKKIVGIIGLTSLSLTLAACNSSKEKTDNGKGSKNQATLTVGFWKGDSTTEDSARKKAFSGFEKEYGIKVEEKIYNDYDTQLMTDLVGGTAPDVFYVDASKLPSLADKKVLEPLDTYIKAETDFDEADFYEPIYNAFKQDDKVYGVPKDYSTLALSYNIKLLEKAGLTEADLPKDYADLEGFLTKLKTKLPDVAPMVFSPLLARQMYIAQADGGKIVKDGLANLDDPKVVKELGLLVELYDKGLIKTADDLGHGWAGDSFGTESAVLSDEGAWANSHYKTNFPDLKYGTTELPTVNGKHANMVFSVSYSMNSASKNKDDAWKLINYLTSTDVMSAYAEEASVLPSRASASEKLDLANDKIVAPFVKAAEYATPWQDGPNLAMIESRYENMITSALKGEMSLEKAMKEASDSANKDIENQIND